VLPASYEPFKMEVTETIAPVNVNVAPANIQVPGLSGHVLNMQAVYSIGGNGPLSVVAVP